MTTERDMQQKQGGDMDAQLENVLEAYAATVPGPSRATLATWIREYPQFARELTDFTARWQLLEWGDEPVDSEAPLATSDLAAEDEEGLILRGMSAAQGVFYAKRALTAEQVQEVSTSSSEASPHAGSGNTRIDSLVAAAERAGLTYETLNERIGLSDALLQKLNRRLIEPPTIPARVLAELAAALQQQVDAVVAYLALAPRFAIGAQHRSEQAPTLPKAREDFFTAVRGDAVLSEARKQELLSLPRPQSGDTSRKR